MTFPFPFISPSGDSYDPPGSVQYDTPGSVGFTIPNYKNFLRITMHGAGGGGGTRSAGPGILIPGTLGGSTTCSALSLTAGGGTGASPYTGGVATGGDVNINGEPPNPTTGAGGASPNGGAGGAAAVGASANGNPGSAPGGGGGGGNSPGGISGPGAGGGAYLQKEYPNGALTPGDILSFSIGAGGPGASANGGGKGGDGANGRVIVEWG